MKLYFTENYLNKIWVLGCTHLGHTKIIGYCNRPFDTVDEQDDKIMKNWNKVVKKNDIVIHLGDFCFGIAKSYTMMLNGKKYLVMGGHDYTTRIKKEDGFEEVCDRIDLRLGKSLFITFDHYPMLSWEKSYHGSYLIYAHNHSEQLDIKNAYNAGSDLNNFTPLLLSDVLEKIDEKKN